MKFWYSLSFFFLSISLLSAADERNHLLESNAYQHSRVINHQPQESGISRTQEWPPTPQYSGSTFPQDFSEIMGTSVESLYRSLLSDERGRLENAKTPDEKFAIGKELYDGSFGVNLFKDQRDKLAEKLFTESGTNSSLAFLGRMYADDRVGFEFNRDQRYERAITLLKKRNAPSDLDKIGDMYYEGKYPGAKLRASGYSTATIDYWPNYEQARIHYKASDTGYGWYSRGFIWMINPGQLPECGGCYATHGKGLWLARRCYQNARERGYDNPIMSKVDRPVLAHILCTTTFCLPILPVTLCVSLCKSNCYGSCVSDDDL